MASSPCAGIFIDVGANVGDSLQMWYGSEGCEDLKARYIERGEAWPGIRRSGCRWEFPPWLPLSRRQTYCAHAFESNPSHSAALARTARQIMLAHPGVRIHVWNGTVLSTHDGDAPFRVDNSMAGSVGSSLLLSKGASNARASSITRVRTVDAVRFLRELHRGHSEPLKPVEMKVDVEGHEDELLRNLLMSGTLWAP